jgi:hypothetical protein
MKHIDEIIKNIEFRKDYCCDEFSKINEEIELLEDKIHEKYIEGIKDKKRINEIENKRRKLIKKFEMIKK